MKATAIIAEFNPLHNGHEYLIEMARRQTNPDCLVVIMSGNFVQRGEPALVNKWLRTRMALAAGADIVLEIPVEESIRSANGFARAGVRIANLLQIDNLVFGSENPRLNFKELSEIIDYQQIDKNYHQSFASQLFKDHSLSPNDILGINYLYWINKLGSSINPIPIQRIMANHNDQEISGVVASATAIRNSLLNHTDDRNTQKSIPSITQQLLSGVKLASWDDFWILLKYVWSSNSIEEMNSTYGMVEGIEHRIASKINDVNSFSELMQEVKTKRYSYTTLQRILLASLLRIPDVGMNNSKPRVLGFNKTGREFLKQTDNSKKVLTKITKKIYATDYYYSARADQIYHLVDQQVEENLPIIV